MWVSRTLNLFPEDWVRMFTSCGSACFYSAFLVRNSFFLRLFLFRALWLLFFFPECFLESRSPGLSAWGVKTCLQGKGELEESTESLESTENTESTESTLTFFDILWRSLTFFAVLWRFNEQFWRYIFMTHFDETLWWDIEMRHYDQNFFYMAHWSEILLAFEELWWPVMTSQVWRGVSGTSSRVFRICYDF